MVNRELRTELLSGLGITKQALSLRAKKFKETYGPMTTEEAVYCIAHIEGIDISKYLSLSLLDRVRSLLPRGRISTNVEVRGADKKKGRKPRPQPVYPLLSSILMKHSLSLGENVYPVLFQLENSLRALIVRILSRYGSDWWLTKVPPDVQSDVTKTMNREKRYPYRDSRGTQPIYYSNFSDLKKIIIAPGNEQDFKDIIINLDWFKVKMDEVYMARNNVAHCVSLSNDDIARINLFHKDWARLLDTAGIK